MIETVLFDLDGTLTDSGPGIIRAVQYALGQMGYAVLPGEALLRFIGPPLHSSFQNFCGMDAEQSVEAVRQFRVYYNETGIFENQVYEGVVEMLAALQAGGKRLVLATSKPEAAARRVMAHFGLEAYIPQIVGGTDDDRRNTKGKVIAHALAGYGIDPKTALMVGDREHDVLGARENNIPCMGITWGYGARAELTNAGAQVVLDHPGEAAQYILRGY